MAFSKHLRGALRSGVFGSHEEDSPISHRQDVDIEQSIYDDKIEGGAYADTGFNYDTDTPSSFEYVTSVSACIGGVANSRFRNRITDDEFNELKNFMTDTTNHKCELRIITQNQRTTNRGHKVGSHSGGDTHPQGQTANVYTPGDLSDVANIFGYRGEDAVNFGDDMLTGPTAESSAAPGYGHQQPGPCGGSGLAYINNLNDYGGTGSNPYITDHYVGGGYPAIIDGGNIQLKRIDGLGMTPLHVPDIVSPTAGYQNMALTFAFPTAGINSQINLNFMYLGSSQSARDTSDILSPTVPIFTALGGGDNAPIIDTNHPQNNIASQEMSIGCYQYKIPITWSDLNHASDIAHYFNYPITYQAIKVLERRNYTTGNTYIPDSFNYTVALVFYTKVAGTNHSHGKVYDIIFDRLRVIDRYDVEIYLQGMHEHVTPEARGNHAHPNVRIIRGTEGNWHTFSSFGTGWTATFPNVPASWVSKYFYNPSGNIYDSGGMGYYTNLKPKTEEFLQNHVGVISITTGSEIRYDDFVYGGRFGCSLSAGYNPTTRELTVAAHAQVAVSNTSPILVFHE